MKTKNATITDKESIIIMSPNALGIPENSSDMKDHNTNFILVKKSEYGTAQNPIRRFLTPKRSDDKLTEPKIIIHNNFPYRTFQNLINSKR